MDPALGRHDHFLLAECHSYQLRLAEDSGRLFSTKEVDVDFYWRRWLTR